MDVTRESLIVLPTNATYKLHKRLLSPSMSTASLTEFTPRINAAVAELVQLWRYRAELAHDTPFPAAADLLNTAVDAVRLRSAALELRLAGCVYIVRHAL